MTTDEAPTDVAVRTAAAWPDLPYPSWAETLATLHRFAQLVGKIRLAASPRRNHWWNVPFHVTGRGITTRPMGADPIFTIDFDFLDHRLDLTTIEGLRFAFPLPGKSVADFTRELLRGLDAVGVRARPALPHPYDLADTDRQFADDHEHATYDPAAVTRYWQTLSRVSLLLEEFAGDWAGKTSPVHHFWHTFDVAVTRFSDRHVDLGPETDPVTREAYSREVISFGFWFGDEAFPEPAFYSYTAPEPDGLADEPLAPPAARWTERNGSHLAVLTYDDARREADPRAAVLDFYGSAFRAGAARAGWDVARDASRNGVTDPHART
ncbi:DUF5996 family protein [Geodermatophilus ruber]|uniref:Ava_C0101 and related proteins n=1 Tax=Geodermatophilus ruber TaxID=504800 RepID=A0A1I4ABT2_9ACTN|nr:DUF5996 family protein [Geodermatophilus ruber]SFK53421.1 hypothetical protein SAMN04488085_102145 [Geodermatophilus ruber]